MKILIDEDVHVKVIDWFAAKGHDVKRTPTGLKNGQVLALAQKELRVLFTRDKDFSNIAVYPPKGKRGIVVMRIHPPQLTKLTAALEMFLSQDPSPDCDGKLILLTEDSFEIIT